MRLMLHKMKIGSFFAAGLMIISFAFQSSVFSAEPEKFKIATVDVGKVFDEYEKTKEFDQQFQNEGKSKKEERDAIVYDVRRLRDEIALTAEDKKKDKQGAIDEKMKQLDKFDESVNVAMKEKRNKAVQEVFQDIESTLQQYGERKGYDFIFNEKAILYRRKDSDITADILQEVNMSYQKAPSMKSSEKEEKK